VDVTRQGYTFDGWYDGETKVERISETDLGDKSFTAKWHVNTYRIIYHNMDGAINHGNNTEEYTFGIDLILGNPTKTGYDFRGWYRDGRY
jgi:uncharacterized repeat protein (TIGR02543 family)